MLLKQWIPVFAIIFVLYHLCHILMVSKLNLVYKESLNQLKVYYRG